MKLSRFVGFVAVSLIAATTTIACGAAENSQTVGASLSTVPSAESSDIYNGVSQTALQACLANGNENCDVVVPGLHQCILAHLQCNKDLHNQLVNQRTHEIASSGVELTAATASSLAIGFSSQPSTATVSAVQALVFSQLPTAGPDETISSTEPADAPIFDVEVDGKIVEPSTLQTAAIAVNHYCILVDADSHQIIDFGYNSTCYAG